MSAFADHVAPNCAPVLESKPKFSGGVFIEQYLHEQGALRGATNAGLIEIWTVSGETIISRLYFSYDGKKPVSRDEMRKYVLALKPQSQSNLRVNAWSVDIKRGGIVTHSVPIEML